MSVTPFDEMIVLVPLVLLTVTAMVPATSGWVSAKLDAAQTLALPKMPLRWVVDARPSGAGEGYRIGQGALLVVG